MTWHPIGAIGGIRVRRPFPLGIHVTYHARAVGAQQVGHDHEAPTKRGADAPGVHALGGAHGAYGAQGLNGRDGRMPVAMQAGMQAGVQAGMQAGMQVQGQQLQGDMRAGPQGGLQDAED